MDFKALILSLSRINEDLREQSIRAVNTSLTMRNWFFGFYILEFEQKGNDRADYGQALPANISREMKTLCVPNSEERELRRYRQFYLTYPVVGTLIRTGLLIRGPLNPELLLSREMLDTSLIRGSADPEFQVSDNHYLNLFDRVSYTHFIEIIRLDDPLKRLFYESECMNGSWSVRKFKRQIGSLLYERTGLSTNKEKLLAMVQAAPTASTGSIMHMPASSICTWSTAKNMEWHRATIRPSASCFVPVKTRNMLNLLQPDWTTNCLWQNTWSHCLTKKNWKILSGWNFQKDNLSGGFS